MTSRRRSVLTLFDPPPQPRLVKPEEPEVYAAVIRARAKKWRVFRAGRNLHHVRRPWGHIGTMTTAELLAHFPPPEPELVL